MPAASLVEIGPSISRSLSPSTNSQNETDQIENLSNWQRGTRCLVPIPSLVNSGTCSCRAAPWFPGTEFTRERNSKDRTNPRRMRAIHICPCLPPPYSEFVSKDPTPVKASFHYPNKALSRRWQGLGWLDSNSKYAVSSLGKGYGLTEGGRRCRQLSLSSTKW